MRLWRLARLADLQADQQLLDRPLISVDMRLPDRLAVHPKTAAACEPRVAGHRGAHGTRHASQRAARQESDMNDLSRRSDLSVIPPSPPDPPQRARGMRAERPFGVLDVGSTKITCLIGRTESDGTLRVLGGGFTPLAAGVRGGGITDLDEAERAIRAPPSRWRRKWPITDFAQ